MSNAIFAGLLLAMLAGCVVGLAYCGFMLRRNSHVFAFRTALIDRIGAECHRRIEAQRGDAFALWDAFHAVSYNEMMKGWRPLEDYYAGTALEADAIACRRP